MYLSQKQTKHYCPNCRQIGRDKLYTIINCAYCGKEIKRLVSEINTNKSGYYYCSRECGNRHKNQLRLEAGDWNDSKDYRKKAFLIYPHKCACCGYDEDARILEVHHIDENHNHNNIDNLIILCPNCHKKITLKLYSLDVENKQLIKLNEPIINSSLRSNTKSLNGPEINNIKYPTRDQLKELIFTKSFTEIGKIYNVSDNAIRRWCKKYSLPTLQKDIKAYTPEQWKFV